TWNSMRHLYCISNTGTVGARQVNSPESEPAGRSPCLTPSAVKSVRLRLTKRGTNSSPWEGTTRPASVGSPVGRADLELWKRSGTGGMPRSRRAWVAGGTFFFTVVTDRRRKLFADPAARTLLGSVFRRCLLRWPFEM